MCGDKGRVCRSGLERQAALFHERQTGNGRHRLGHGRKRKNGIRRHRRAFGRIKLAVRLVMDELSVPGYCDHGAGHTFGGDLASEEFVEPLQSLLRESDVVRLCLRQRRGICHFDNDADNHGCGDHERLHCLLPRRRIKLARLLFNSTSAGRILRSRLHERQVKCGSRAFVRPPQYADELVLLPMR